MAKAKPKDQDQDQDQDQVKAFRKAARELGCDETEERFQNALRKIAKPRAKAGLSEKSPKSRSK
jgi:hypothetical protein